MMRNKTLLRGITKEEVDELLSAQCTGCIAQFNPMAHPCKCQNMIQYKCNFCTEIFLNEEGELSLFECTGRLIDDTFSKPKIFHLCAVCFNKVVNDNV